MNLNDNEYFRLALCAVMGVLGGIAKLLDDETELTFRKAFKVLFTSGFTALMVGALIQYFDPNISVMLVCFVGGISGVGGLMILNKIIDIALSALNSYVNSKVKDKE